MEHSSIRQKLKKEEDFKSVLERTSTYTTSRNNDTVNDLMTPVGRRKKRILDIDSPPSPSLTTIRRGIKMVTFKMLWVLKSVYENIGKVGSLCTFSNH